MRARDGPGDCSNCGKTQAMADLTLRRCDEHPASNGLVHRVVPNDYTSLAQPWAVSYLLPTSSVSLQRRRCWLSLDLQGFGARHGHDDRCGVGFKNFGSVDLGDARRTRRLIASAARIAATPGRTFNTTFDWNDLRGFYNLCDAKTATVDHLQHAHRQLTREAMAEHAVVLVLPDTSEIDFTSHKALADIGPIGDGRGRGILQHNSLAIVPGSRHVLGLAHQQLRMRKPAPKRETSGQRKKRERESALWTNGIAAVGRPPDGVRWVDVADAAADDYEAMRSSLDVGHDFLLRVSQDRQVWSDEARTQPARMLDWARNLGSIGTDTVTIPARGGPAARPRCIWRRPACGFRPRRRRRIARGNR